MNVLFVYNDLRSFVKADLEILQSAHTVRPIQVTYSPKNISQIIDGVRWCDLVFGWWASWHMVLPAILTRSAKKKLIVVGGDYDIIFWKQNKSLERLLRDEWRKALGPFLFSRIDHFIVNSEFSKGEALKLKYVDQTRLSRVYHGFPDITGQKPINKKNLVLTVGNITRYELSRKGLATFVRAASDLPEYEFKLVGSWQNGGMNALRKMDGNHVQYTGYLPEAELYQAMSDARVYVQVSRHEGFGMAMTEAMLFECVPVVTDRGAIPEVVGDCGYYVPYDNPEKTAQAIRQAYSDSTAMGHKARERVLDHFPLKKRRDRILEVIENTCSTPLV